MDPQVRAMYLDKNKKNDVFNLWLKHARDFGAVGVEVSRQNIQRQSAHRNTVTWSKIQLQQSGRYTEDDITALIDRCTRSGNFIDDPNFPGVERLRRYVIVDEVGSTMARVQEDTQRVASTGQISTQEAVALTSEGVPQIKPKSCL